MKKTELLILTFLLVGIIVGDLLLFMIYNKIEHTRTTLIMENMYNKNDIISEIQSIGRMLY